LAVAGFRTDWPQDPNNPIFSPQPNGFGAVKTNLAIIKIPFALAYQVSERLSIGGAIDLFQGSLAISPLPPAVPDCTLGDPATGVTRDCFYADADNTVTSYAVSLQLGVHFQVNERWSLGASYTTAQDYDDYEWNSSIALPYLRQGDGSTIVNPDFGRGRTIRYALDGAAIASVGAAYRHSERLQIGVDVRFIEYTSVDGAGGVGGFKPDGSLNEIGWDDIWVGAIGVEYHASERLTLRGGFNYGETPIREAVVFTSLGTPPTFEQHYTFGLGLQLTDAVRLDVGAYYVPENSISGPVLNPNLVPNPTTIAEQTVPGATFTLSEELRSVLFAFNFQF
ncbi:MAG: outer membrane protein transport protein, partial [Acidobacteriota bacterium]